MRETQENTSKKVASPFIVLEPAKQWSPIRAFPSTVLGMLLKGYRAVISPIYGDVCRFFPTCSAYALEAVTVHGAIKGGALAARRIMRCHPWQAGGIDAVPAGRRTWSSDQLPRIIQLNHPEVPDDPPAPETEG